MTSRLLILATVAVLGAGCRPAAPPLAAPAPDDPVGRAAYALLRECAVGPPAEVARCREEALLGVLQAQGAGPTMTLLERMAELDPEVGRQGHSYAHAIGLAAYTTADEVGPVFGSCTPSFQSGCYHGVIQSYFADLAEGAGPGAITAEAVNALCAEQRGEDGDRWLLFQCAHGMGHGLTTLHGHHLPKALAGCDLLADAWEREACYGGAFMENVVQAVSPHHALGRPQQQAAAGHDEHAHHAEYGGESGFKALDPADPLYPCTVLEDRYLTSCYQMQTSAVLHFARGDFRAAVRACEQARERYRGVCYQSMGRDVSSYTRQNHGEAVRLCALAEPTHRVNCHEGYAKNLVDLTARADDGFAFCRVLEDAAEKRACYEAVGEEVWVLETGAAEREALCAAVEGEFVDACRAGAGLPSRSGAASAPAREHPAGR